MSERLRLVLLACACAAIGVAAVQIGRRHELGPGTSRSVYFRGEAIAAVTEQIDREHAAPGAVEHVVRRVRLDALDSDTVVVNADLDGDGFVRAAHSVRPQQREVAVTFIDDVPHLVVDQTLRLRLPKRPVVLIELLPRVRSTTPHEVTLVDLSSAETTAARIERRGPDIVALIDGRVVARAIPEGRRTGPGAFVEDDTPPRRPTADIVIALAGVRHIRGKRLGGAARELPPLRAAVDESDVQPGPFIESTAAAVKAFAQPLCRPALTETARVVAEAVHARVDARENTSAPGALAMLRHGGDCDGAAALVVASMRACGFASRAIVGYRLVDAGTDGARLVPHAVAEVYRASLSADGKGGWWRIDATVPALGDLDDVFVPVAEGLGGALSMGRVLGVLEPGDVVDGDNVGP